MYKRLILAVFVMLMAAMLAVTALAEPTDSSDISGSSEVSTSEVSSTEVSSTEVSSTESAESSDLESADSSHVSSATSSKTSQFYIPDDSDYYTGSMSDLQQASGGSVPSGLIPGGDTSVPTSSAPPVNRRSTLKSIIAKYIWIPIGVIALCILVLVCFNRVYAVKYRPIDPIAKLKAQKKGRNVRHERPNSDPDRNNKNRTHRPRD